MKKFVCALLAGVMSMSLLAGCGSKPTEPDANAPADGGENNTTAGETLRMVTNAAFAPYEFVDDNGEVAGIDAEIAAAIAEKLGMKLEITDMAFESLLPALQSGSADIILAGMTVNAERQESVDFTDSYAKGVQVIIVPEGSEIAGPDDLNGKQIGVQTGTTGDQYCSDTPENGGFGEDAVQRYDNGPLAVAALLNGQVDAVVIDNEPAKALVAANEGLKILDTAYTDEDYAAAVQKGNTELLDKVNAALEELKADGTIDEILAKYIHE
ncbi:MAG: basic amino acid ABC transporter substrate-binding protein [Eubacteriales bacterium]|nr:basic amino acid ABC transporter substrate-binding protein [Eubacteriales bacterium]